MTSSSVDELPSAAETLTSQIPSDTTPAPSTQSHLPMTSKPRQGSCSHGATCKYAHGEKELRQKPDNTWDPTSERGKKAKMMSDNAAAAEEEEVGDVMFTEEMMDEEGGGDGVHDLSLSKCLVHLPTKWQSDDLKTFLREQGVEYKFAKKRRGMMVGFLTFENAEQLKNGVEILEGKNVNNKSLKIADVLPRTFDKNGAKNPAAKLKSAREAVTPLADLSYVDQLEQKKASIANAEKTVNCVTVVLAIMFSLTFVLLVYAKCCHIDLRPRTNDGIRQDRRIIQGIFVNRSTNSSDRFSGLDKTVIESLPLFRFSALKGSKQGLDCSVCLSKFESVEILRLLPKCRHAFHIGCIDQWLEQHATCPLCRDRVSIEEEHSVYGNSFRFLNQSEVREDSSLELYIEREEEEEEEVGGSSRLSIGDSFRKILKLGSLCLMLYSRIVGAT
ncbi:hypothetical protein Bca52824_048428 [Brassica carinata]|uniref:RING-type E3 ubiquitin transferase n=1 Tax=Brassica carinata TaxID=52824 RepID=A0A8X7US67_BRACI|nr:hypothetical protein Bca52824_048428 [Brassica carinata]